MHLRRCNMPLIAKIELTHTIASIHSSCSQGRMRFRHPQVLTPVRCAERNAFAERWVRTVRQDCLDHLLVVSGHHLERTLAEYVTHYNRGRPHRSLDLTPPPD